MEEKKAFASVELGDFFRQSQISSDFYMVVGFWQKSKAKIVQENIILVPHDLWSQQFDVKNVEKNKTLFDGITNSYSDDAKWRQRMKEFKDNWNSVETGIQINPKRDHKNQKRLQCSIKTEFMEFLISKHSVDPYEFNRK